ncbi:MAG: transcriptional repressor [Bryobacterales bacterium]|nr:transcriptional repressor [Bryobacterales bacterium]
MREAQQHGVRGRSTAQRRAIFDTIRHFEFHPTADEIYREVNRNLPVTSRATVYNTLHHLKQAGVVRELHEGGVTRFDANPKCHHHFVCTVCGGIEDVAWEALPELRKPVLKDVRIESYSVTLRGVCASCNRASKEEIKKHGRN